MNPKVLQTKSKPSKYLICKAIVFGGGKMESQAYFSSFTLSHTQELGTVQFVIDPESSVLFSPPEGKGHHLYFLKHPVAMRGPLLGL